MNQHDAKQDRLTSDWAIIWASEANALAVDREVAEAMARMLYAWAGQMTALYSALPHDPSGPAAPALPPGSPPTATPP